MVSPPGTWRPAQPIPTPSPFPAPPPPPLRPLPLGSRAKAAVLASEACKVTETLWNDAVSRKLREFDEKAALNAGPGTGSSAASTFAPDAPPGRQDRGPVPANPAAARRAREDGEGTAARRRFHSAPENSMALEEAAADADAPMASRRSATGTAAPRDAVDAVRRGGADWCPAGEGGAGRGRATSAGDAGIVSPRRVNIPVRGVPKRAYPPPSDPEVTCPETTCPDQVEGPDHASAQGF